MFQRATALKKCDCLPVFNQSLLLIQLLHFMCGKPTLIRNVPLILKNQPGIVVRPEKRRTDPAFCRPTNARFQWRSQPKNFGGKVFNFRRITLFCLGYRLSKAQNDCTC